mgnify:CR=1 FL=1
MSIYWTDGEGVEHLIEYMSDRYLLNCIRFVENKIEQNPNYKIEVLNVLFSSNHNIHKGFFSTKIY